MNFSNRELIRYSRHTMLPQIGIAGQEKLKAARVLVIGAGGLGSPVALYLASAGVGTLVLVDDDSVELSNLQRQIVHDEAQLNVQKVASAKTRITAMNSDINVETIAERLGSEALAKEVMAATAVVDCSDNFATRFAVNTACLAAQTPLIQAAAIRGEGQLTVFDSRNENSPCYRCLYSDAIAGQENCSTQGVLAPLVGVMGSLQAMETIKIITNAGHPPVGRLLLFDAWHTSWREIQLPRDPECPACGNPSAS